jgi:predicted 2-oxoglutarate/Fe(II)-dependent dioxygenase YbiX
MLAVLLSKLGVLVVDHFAPDDLRRTALADVLAADGSDAEVFATPGREIAPSMRNATERRAGASAAAVQALIESARSRLEAHFQLALGACEPMSYVTYGPGQFYRPHVDRGPADRIDDARDRAVSVVLFLNDATTPADCTFDGGALVFYDLLGDPRARRAGFPLPPKAGMLVAFPSDFLHEVTPVTRGVRAVAVSWFHGRPSTSVGASGSVR